ncbi:MAG: holin family protein [Albidovulum sp.]
MGMIGRILGTPSATAAIGEAATSVAEVFTPNATKKMQAAQEAYLAALEEHGAEFQYARTGAFDRFVNGLNRLPRPLLAMGTLGLFTYAMIDPDSFTRRMVGLNYVPEPLWWLLAAIVGFYFGAREAHYFRSGTQGQSIRPAKRPATPADDNPALAEWQRRHST